MTEVKDLTGLVFGILTVIKRHPVNSKAQKARWIVRCECGAYKIVVSGALISGLVVSCGSGHYMAEKLFVDLTNQVFGNLTVLGISGRVKSTNMTKWNVRCVCGHTETYIGKTLLKNNRVLCSRCSSSPKLIDRTGHSYGKWTVVSYAGKSKRGGTLWNVICKCGRTGVASGGNLSSGASSQCRVCGDNSENSKTHGKSRTPEYAAWMARGRIEKKRILDNSWTLEMDSQLREFFSACVLCGQEFSLDVDHLLPLNLGYGLFTDNALILCDSCNSRKRATYISDLPPETRRKLIDASCAFQDHLEEQLYRSACV